ncbi:MAG: DUF5722 domain-containing protein [Armatimonadota bacterium]
MPAVSSIIATRDQLSIQLQDAPAGVPASVKLCAPWDGSVLAEMTTSTNADGHLSVPRHVNHWDALTLLIKITMEGEELDGVSTVTDMDDIATYSYDYPVADSIKGLQVAGSMVDDAIKLGVRHAAINLNQGDIMMPGPGQNISEYKCNGQCFYFDEAYMEKFDETIRNLTNAGIIVSLILLNSPNWRREMSQEMKDILMHPHYNPEGLISAFNLTNETGFNHYQAFVEYAANRFSDPSGVHGRVWGYIVGNEIDSQWVWGNAGEMSCHDYMAEYTLAMRTTWLAAQKINSASRVYISLTHLFNISHLKNQLQTYPAAQCLKELAAYCAQDGDFPWAVAFHPYPEDLRFPDFWNDETAWDTLDTPRITFKNIHMLPKFLEQPEYLYRGQRRKIILSEQGFNSHKTDISEQFQAAAYALAFENVQACPEIEAFILHAHIDNLDEFGLNLGMWRVDDKNVAISKKPIYDVFDGIEGPKREEILAWAHTYLDKKMNRKEEERLY